MSAETARETSWLARIAPGVPKLLAYDRANLSKDVGAGLAVAAVALPVGVAYAQLAGFSPSVGLYASILPVVAYALFGTSRQLIVGPDAATCAIVAASVAPLAGGDTELYQSLAVAMTFLAGVLCIFGMFLRIGALVDFLSKPILVGFMNGIALQIALGQMGKILGFSVKSPGILRPLAEVVQKLPQTHFPTVAVAAGSFVILVVSPKLTKRVPASLVAMVAGGIAVAALHLEAKGVKVVGPVAGGLPQFRIPRIPGETVRSLVGDAAGLALVSFSSMMATARSFAAKNGYEIDADKEFAALGAANVAAAFSQSFAISGAASRTAMSDGAGGRTQVTGLVAAGCVTVVLLFLTGPLQYIPQPALGAVLVMAAISLANVAELKKLWGIDRVEVGLAALVTFAVVVAGAVDAILVAVLLAVVRFVRISARPSVDILGEAPDYPGFHSLARHPEAKARPGVLIVRFNGPLVFFNAGWFKRHMREAVTAAGPGLRAVILDMLTIPTVDATGLDTWRETAKELHASGVTVALAGRMGEWDAWATKRGFVRLDFVRSFPTLRSAVRALEADAASATSAPSATTEKDEDEVVETENAKEPVT
jgi:high affinity sulfate transporter 1